MISIIAAVDKNWLIGQGEILPWYFSEDLQFFKEKTMGKYVVFGEKTYRSLPKKFSGRKIIVLSHEKENFPKNVFVAGSVEEVFSKTEGEVFIAGGRSVYKQFIGRSERMYLTRIKKNFKGDVYFPKFNKKEWRIKNEKKGKNPLLFFQTWEKAR